MSYYSDMWQLTKGERLFVLLFKENYRAVTEQKTIFEIFVKWVEGQFFIR